jgi:DNA-binding GntR family transcriptional regulator
MRRLDHPSRASPAKRPRTTKDQPAGAQAPQRSLAQGAYDALRAAIQNGKLAPGQRIVEADIGEWLKVSRTPVREALRQLQSEGMIEPKSGGMAVVSLDLRAISELYAIRETLEGAAAALAARHADPTEIAMLQSMIAAHRESTGDARAQAHHNHVFHEQLYHAAHNRFLLKSTQALRDSLVLLGPTTLALPARAAAAWAEHDEVVAAIAAHDPVAAEAAARRHIRAGYEERVRAMTEGMLETTQYKPPAADLPVATARRASPKAGSTG